METALTSDAFSPELIFRGLKGNIIDYVISSYHVNVALILMYYYRPELQIHCDSYTNGSGKEPFIHTHKLPKDGIYHAKFVLVTTTEACRLIIMTTNITEAVRIIALPCGFFGKNGILCQHIPCDVRPGILTKSCA